MDRPSPELVGCPLCGARNFAIDEVCDSCGRPLAVVIGPRPRVRRVNLATVMVLIALVAVCLAPIRVAPAASILLMAILIPTTVRVLLAIEERKADGRPMSFPQTFDAAFASCGITILILLAATIAFVVTCVPTGFCMATGRVDERVGLSVANLSGATCALFVAYRVGRRLWPRKD